MRKALFAGAAALALSVSSMLPATNVFAAGDISFTNSEVTISRSISSGSNSVINTFGYEITPASGTATVEGMPTSAQIVFDGDEEAVDGKVSSSSKISVGNAEFKTVGDYYYTVAETSSTFADTYPISNKTYQIVVSVRNVLGDSNVPTGDFTATVVLLESNGAKHDGGDSFELAWEGSTDFTYIQADAQTIGNLGDQTYCFEYTIDIPASDRVKAGNTYTISTSSTCTGSDTTLVAGQLATVYLRHNDNVKIGQQGSNTNELPIGASYTITKVDSNDGYTTTIDTVETREKQKTAVSTANTSEYNVNNVTHIVNERNGDPVTGIMTNIWTYVVLLAAGVVGIFFASKKYANNEQ